MNRLQRGFIITELLFIGALVVGLVSSVVLVQRNQNLQESAREPIEQNISQTRQDPGIDSGLCAKCEGNFCAQQGENCIPCWPNGGGSQEDGDPKCSCTSNADCTAPNPTSTPPPTCNQIGGDCIPNGEDCIEEGNGTCGPGKYCCKKLPTPPPPTPSPTCLNSGGKCVPNSNICNPSTILPYGGCIATQKCVWEWASCSAPTPTPTPISCTAAGFNCVINNNICIANGGTVKSNPGCTAPQVCCSFPATPTPTPAPLGCEDLFPGASCVPNSYLCDINLDAACTTGYKCGIECGPYIPPPPDTTPPIISSFSPEPGSLIGEQVVITVKITDNTGVDPDSLVLREYVNGNNNYSFGGERIGNTNYYEFEVSFLGFNENYVTLVVSASDLAGNTASKGEIYSMDIVDTEPPIIQIYNPFNKQIISGQQFFYFEVTDLHPSSSGLSTINWTLEREGGFLVDGDGWGFPKVTYVDSEYFYWDSINYSDATYTLSVWASDKLNNHATSQVNFTVKNAPDTAPQPPSNLTIDSQSLDSRNLSWDPPFNKSNITHYLVQRSGSIGSVVSYKVDFPTTNFIDTFDITCGVNYNYQVRSLNENSPNPDTKVSPPSNTVAINIPCTPGTNLPAPAISSATIDLHGTAANVTINYIIPGGASSGVKSVRVFAQGSGGHYDNTPFDGSYTVQEVYFGSFPIVYELTALDNAGNFSPTSSITVELPDPGVIVEKGYIVGSVSVNGAPAVGASIIAVANASGKQVTASTNDAGDYLMSVEAIGTYTVSAILLDGSGQTKQVVVDKPGEAVNLNFDF